MTPHDCQFERAPRRPSRRAGKALLVGLVALAALLAVILWIVWRRGPSQPSMAAGQAVCDLFLEQIRGGKAAEAWQATTAEFKSAEGRESFARYVQARPYLRQPLLFGSVQTVSIGNAPRTEFLYRAAGGEKSVRILVANEGGAWRVDRLAAP